MKYQVQYQVLKTQKSDFFSRKIITKHEQNVVKSCSGCEKKFCYKEIRKISCALTCSEHNKGVFFFKKGNNKT